MSGFDNEVLYADNVDFTGSEDVSPRVKEDGQLLIGAADSPSIRVSTLTAGPGVSIINGPGSITIGLSGVEPPSTFSQINIQTFTSSGTYTPTAGMKYCIIECVGGGGGGGGAGGGALAAAAGGGGGGAGYARRVASAATIGVSQTVTIGAAGSAGTSVPGVGGTGGSTFFGSICSASGGSGGGAGTSSAVLIIITNGGPGVGLNGDLLLAGSYGSSGFANFPAGYTQSGYGGASHFSGSSRGLLISASGGTTNGLTGRQYGGGGSGGVSFDSATSTTGGAGIAGIVVVTEYI